MQLKETDNETADTATAGKAKTKTKIKSTKSKKKTQKSDVPPAPQQPTEPETKITVAQDEVPEAATSAPPSSTPTQETTVAIAVEGPVEEPKVKKPSKNKKKNKYEKLLDETLTNKKITDYFTIRKSSRRCASDLEKIKKEQIENAIVNKIEEGLDVREIEHKGRGVFAARNFCKNDFIVEYYGDLITYQEAKRREEEYSKDASIGCYMYFFEFKNKQYCIDATSEKITRLGRLLNHSRTSPNCHTKLIDLNGNPVLGIYASRDIEPGEELVYDYGDRDKKTLEAHPWLNS